MLSWLEDLGWRVVLERRVRDALGELNPGLPVDAYRKLTWPEGATVEARNREFHWMLVNGVEIEYRGGRGSGPRQHCPCYRPRQPRRKRLACGQPVHRQREQEYSQD